MEVFEETVRLDELIRRRTFLEVAESGAQVDPEERTRAADKKIKDPVILRQL